MKHTHSEQWIAFFLVAAGVFLRLIPHPSNVTPVAAIALLSGAVLPMSLALTVPVGIMIVTDLVIGTHDLYWLTWACFFATTLIGLGLGHDRKPLRLLGASFLGSTVFYVVTNLGVFALQNMYPKNWQGLVECYGMALPFFRNQIVGDLLYTAVFFGVFFLASRTARLRQI